MNSIFSDNIWLGKSCYVTSKADFIHHNLDPEKADIGKTCLVTFSSELYKRVAEIIPQGTTDFSWPYCTTPLQIGITKSGKRFAIHFPSYGGTRIANSLEQLAACGIRNVIGLGLGGTPQINLKIGDVVLLEGAIRGDGVSRYYSPTEYPAIADLTLTARIHEQLEMQHENHVLGLSFGIDALYREEEHLVKQLRELGVLSIDLESSAFLVVGRRLGVRCCWLGVISDRLFQAKHEGNIHSEHIMDKLLLLTDYIVQMIDNTDL